MVALALDRKVEVIQKKQNSLLYTRFFGLRSLPFSLTPDPEYFFNHTSSQDALNKLLFATRSGEGFVKVTGEVGTGKTLLCRTFLNSLGEQFIVAYIPNPYMESLTLLMAIADELGVAYSAHANQHELLKSLTEFLLNSYAKTGKTVVICLDEAHAMPRASMEVLRLLSNLETAKRKLLQLVLFAQPEFNERLNHSTIRQLKQRISFSGELNPMSRTETEDYISHRLAVSGYQGPRLFTRSAMRLVYRTSGGVPRLINILVHKSLIAAYAETSRIISLKHVVLAVEDTDSVKSQRWYPESVFHLKNYFLAVAAGSVLTAVAAGLHNLLVG